MFFKRFSDDFEQKMNKIQNIVLFFTSEFSKANLTLYSPQVILTGRPKPAGKSLYTLT